MQDSEVSQKVSRWVTGWEVWARGLGVSKGLGFGPYRVLCDWSWGEGSSGRWLRGWGVGRSHSPKAL